MALAMVVAMVMATAAWLVLSIDVCVSRKGPFDDGVRLVCSCRHAFGAYMCKRHMDLASTWSHLCCVCLLSNPHIGVPDFSLTPDLLLALVVCLALPLLLS